MQSISSFIRLFKSFKKNFKSIQQSLQTHASRQAFAIAVFVGAMQASSEAAAFSAPFLRKLAVVLKHSVLIGKSFVALAVVWAIIAMLGNKPPNWVRIGIIGGVGVALCSAEVIIKFFVSLD